MTVPSVFELCKLRDDVLEGTVTEADFAADLAQVIVNKGPDDYIDPARFFANTYPTQGLRDLLRNVCSRLSGAGDHVASIFRLDTSYGGGKTHALIALCHVARSRGKVPGIEEFIDPAILPTAGVRIAAFDGENADPANGRRMADGHLAFTPWGEIASALAGRDGYERVRKSDETGEAPGAETLRELFGGEPTLILLDELSVYLRKVQRRDNARDQLTAFLTSLFKAIGSAPNAVVVFTLAIGKDGSSDAYSQENQFIADKMQELTSVAGRTATLLNPTEEHETIQVLKRRLFESIDESAAVTVVDAYRDVWNRHREELPEYAQRPEIVDEFRSGYPLHPDVLKTLTSKTATLDNFQRVRGMLRLLARTLSHLWNQQPSPTTAIHVHHIDPGYEPVRQEILTRLGQEKFRSAISNDIASLKIKRESLAEQIDEKDHRGLQPFARYVARTIFIHSLAFNDALKGISPEDLRFAVLGPDTDISFIEGARKSFIADSSYLDDRPGMPMRFLIEANLQQVIRRAEGLIDRGEARSELNDRIREIFNGKTFDVVPFPGGPFDVADDLADGRPKLVVLGYEAATIGVSVDHVPDLVERIFERTGLQESALRKYRNNLVFVVADDARTDDMRRTMFRRMALRAIRRPERLSELADHQQDRVRELETRSEQQLAIAIQHCYRHVFYPTRNRIEGSQVDLGHTAIDTPSTSDRPGVGQRQVERVLRDLNKLRLPEDNPDSPTYVRDRTPLKNKGQITTLSLREEFRRAPSLPILVGDDTFVRGVRLGIEEGHYVYRRGDLLCGPGDPMASIEIDEQSMILTMDFAKKNNVWPRPSSEKTSGEDDRSDDDSDGQNDEGDTTSEGESDKDHGTGPVECKAEGVLREALVKVWEQAREKKIESIATLTIAMYEAGDAFRLFQAVAAVTGATKSVRMEGGYDTREGGSFQLEFDGPIPDAQPVREFLGPQFRDAKSSTLNVTFRLDFADGLKMESDAAERLTERLNKFASGAAYVSATASAKT
ncbi:MAG: DUF499 domain-containing protein [bacterium]|nr:DUF499 domain-containing protein [bacterium]